MSKKWWLLPGRVWQGLSMRKKTGLGLCSFDGSALAVDHFFDMAILWNGYAGNGSGAESATGGTDRF